MTKRPVGNNCHASQGSLHAFKQHSLCTHTLSSYWLQPLQAGRRRSSCIIEELNGDGSPITAQLQPLCADLASTPDAMQAVKANAESRPALASAWQPVGLLLVIIKTLLALHCLNNSCWLHMVTQFVVALCVSSTIGGSFSFTTPVIASSVGVITVCILFQCLLCHVSKQAAKSAVCSVLCICFD